MKQIGIKKKLKDPRFNILLNNRAINLIYTIELLNRKIISSFSYIKTTVDGAVSDLKGARG